MINNFSDVLASGNINLSKIEAERKFMVDELKKKQKVFLLIAGGITFIILLLCFITNFWYLLFSILIVLIVFAVWKGKQNQKIIAEIKNNLVRNLVKTVNPSFEYYPKNFVSQDVFKRSEFIKSWSTYTGEDYFSGTIENKLFQFSELTLKVKSDKSYSVVFKGMFMDIQIPFNFIGRATIVPDYLEKNLGVIGRTLQKISFNRINDKLLKIENPEFENYFAVYSKNEAETLKLFQNNLCSFLINFKKVYGERASIYFAYETNHIYLGVSNSFDIFKVNINEEIDEANIQNYYNEFVDYLNFAINLSNLVQKNFDGFISTNNKEGFDGKSLDNFNNGINFQNQEIIEEIPPKTIDEEQKDISKNKGGINYRKVDF